MNTHRNNNDVKRRWYQTLHDVKQRWCQNLRLKPGGTSMLLASIAFRWSWLFWARGLCSQLSMVFGLRNKGIRKQHVAKNRALRSRTRRLHFGLLEFSRSVYTFQFWISSAGFTQTCKRRRMASLWFQLCLHFSVKERVLKYQRSKIINFRHPLGPQLWKLLA